MPGWSRVFVVSQGLGGEGNRLEWKVDVPCNVGGWKKVVESGDERGGPPASLGFRGAQHNAQQSGLLGPADLALILALPLTSCVPRGHIVGLLLPKQRNKLDAFHRNGPFFFEESCNTQQNPATR